MITPYSSEEIQRNVPQAASLHGYEQTIDLLDTEDLSQLAIDGQLTVAMIRPNLVDCVLDHNGTDAELESVIESRIMGLGFITKFAVDFDSQAVEEFYGGSPKEVQLTLPPERYLKYPSRWEEFVDLMLSGRTTVILLHNVNAISRWRTQVGHYDVINRRDPTTIRGIFAKDNYNNLIHGSDSPEAVVREIDILTRLIKRTTKSKIQNE